MVRTINKKGVVLVRPSLRLQDARETKKNPRRPSYLGPPLVAPQDMGHDMFTLLIAISYQVPQTE